MLLYNKLEQSATLRQFMRTVCDPLEKMAKEAEDPFQVFKTYFLPDNVVMRVVNRSGKIVFSRGDLLDFNPYTHRNLKGEIILESMFRQARKSLAALSVVHHSQNNVPSQYYGRHFYLPKQDLLVGVWTDTSMVEAVYNAYIDDCIRDLRYYFQGLSLGQTGFLFILDKDGRVIVGPKDMKTDMNDGTKSLMELVRKASLTPKTPLLLPEFDAFDKENPREALLFARYIKTVKYFAGGVVYLDEAREPGRELSFSLVLGVLLTLLIVLPLAVWLTTKAIKPLGVLARYARKIPEEDFMQNATPSPALQKLAAGRDAEISELASSFLFMDATLRSRVRSLMDATVARERLQAELTTALEIQMGFLPSPLSEEICANRFSLAASLESAREVGGDLYDFFMSDDNRLCFIIGDVSGKGIPAALFMSMTLTLIRANQAAHPTPERLVQVLNNCLATDNSKCMFVTLFIGVLDLSTGELLYANAGHNPPVLLRPDGTVAWLKGLSGPVVGVVEDVPYSLSQTQLLPGESLFLYTDGLNEAMDASNNQFSNERMLKTLGTCCTDTPEAILATMRNDVDKHTAGYPPSDDITMLCVRYRGLEPGKEGVC
ncbi:MAG: SpoIIE family protein phosphatase [Bilophila sp.]